MSSMIGPMIISNPPHDPSFYLFKIDKNGRTFKFRPLLSKSIYTPPSECSFPLPYDLCYEIWMYSVTQYIGEGNYKRAIILLGVSKEFTRRFFCSLFKREPFSPVMALTHLLRICLNVRHFITALHQNVAVSQIEIELDGPFSPFNFDHKAMGLVHDDWPLNPVYPNIKILELGPNIHQLAWIGGAYNEGILHCEYFKCPVICFSICNRVGDLVCYKEYLENQDLKIFVALLKASLPSTAGIFFQVDTDRFGDGITPNIVYEVK